MRVGDEIKFSDKIIKLQKLENTTEANFLKLIAYFKIEEKNKTELVLEPEIRIYDKPETITSEAAIKTDIFKDRFLVVNLVKENEYLNVRYQEKPFMLWIWISAIIISLGGIINIFKKMKNRYYKYSIVIFLIFTFFIFYYGLKEKNFYTPEDISIKKFPNLILNDFYTNSETSFDDILIGSNYYLVNIWASWCLPCREEHPYLVQLKKNSPIKIIGINYKDKKDNALKFLDEYENPYLTILTDNNGIASIEIGAYGVPESFILNKEKKIIKKIIGPIDKKKFNEIKELIKK